MNIYQKTIIDPPPADHRIRFQGTGTRLGVPSMGRICRPPSRGRQPNLTRTKRTQNHALKPHALRIPVSLHRLYRGFRRRPLPVRGRGMSTRKTLPGLQAHRLLRVIPVTSDRPRRSELVLGAVVPRELARKPEPATPDPVIENLRSELSEARKRGDHAAATMWARRLGKALNI